MICNCRIEKVNYRLVDMEGKIFNVVFVLRGADVKIGGIVGAVRVYLEAVYRKGGGGSNGG